MNNLSLSAQSSLWALFQLKSSKKRNFLIFVVLLPIIFLLSCFIVDIVLNSINFIQYFEFNSKNIKAEFIESMHAYSSVKVVFYSFLFCYSSINSSSRTKKTNFKWERIEKKQW